MDVEPVDYYEVGRLDFALGVRDPFRSWTAEYWRGWKDAEAAAT